MRERAGWRCPPSLGRKGGGGSPSGGRATWEPLRPCGTPRSPQRSFAACSHRLGPLTPLAVGRRLSRHRIDPQGSFLSDERDGGRIRPGGRESSDGRSLLAPLVTAAVHGRFSPEGPPRKRNGSVWGVGLVFCEVRRSRDDDLGGP